MLPGQLAEKKQTYDAVELKKAPVMAQEVTDHSTNSSWPEASIMLGKRGGENVYEEYCQEHIRPSGSSTMRYLAMAGCCLTGIGFCYLNASHYLIPDGMIGVSMNDGYPEIYGPGRHVLLSPVNGNLKMFPATQSHIQVGSLHIINVNDDQFGLGAIGGDPRILYPGLHVSFDPMFEFKSFVSQRDPVLEHGSLHRIIVSEGTRALAWVGNSPKIFTAGIYYFVSPLFRYVKAVQIDTNLAELDSFNIVTVDDGRIGIAYDKGVLRILPPGEHWMNAQKNQKFLDFLPTTQQVRQLKTLDVLTNDGLMVRIQGSITFRVNDPHKAVLNIGSDDDTKMNERDITRSIFATIMRRANDTLASLLTGTSILTSAGMGFADSTVNVNSNDVPTYEGKTPVQPDQIRADHKATDDHKEKQADHGNQGDDGMELNALIRQRFKESLTHTLSREWGVELSDMNVIDIEVMDEAVRSALAEGVRSNIVAVTDRKTAESKSETARILAQGHRDAAKIKTDGETYAIEELAKAQLKAGQLLEQTPVAVDIRMAETAAKALSDSKSSLVISPDSGFSTLMSLIGSTQRMAPMKRHNSLPKLPG